jgi:hypothetical protein
MRSHHAIVLVINDTVLSSEPSGYQALGCLHSHPIVVSEGILKLKSGGDVGDSTVINSEKYMLEVYSNIINQDARISINTDTFK